MGIGTIILVLVVLFIVFGMCGASQWFSDRAQPASVTPSGASAPTVEHDPVDALSGTYDADYEQYGFSPQRGVDWGRVSRDTRRVRVTVPGGDLLSLRDAPSARHGTRLARIPEAAGLVITGCLPPRPEDGARWCQTSYGDTDGWVYDLYVQPEGEYAAEFQKQEKEAYEQGFSPERGVNQLLERPANRAVRVAVPGSRPIPMRDAPSGEHGAVLTEVPSGATLRLLSCLPPRPEDSGQWCRTSHAGRSGWVYDRYLDDDDASMTNTAAIQTERIVFEYMATRATVSGATPPSGATRYLMNVRRGQTVRAEVSGSDASVDVYAPGRPLESGYRAPSDVSGRDRWQGVVSQSGDYQIVVRGGRFSLTVRAE